MFPTFAKLVAGVLFAALAWWISAEVAAMLESGRAGTVFGAVNAGLSFFMGWRILGRHAGVDLMTAIGFGITTAVAAAVVCIGAWAFHEMIGRSLDLFYDGPVEALEAMIEIALYDARLLGAPQILAALFGGGAVIGLVAGLVGKVSR
ncbi:TrgA family protein [Palleronia sediminis]|uniref:TrgA family protein n=1 Tax=Palleronia sediminis TaxID=2547833 RepID=A0A4R6AIN8_9RHOB|nr:TrgA family protein [Palleronia sediminis]TDL84071.1 TrgA family protein [Palleronia sediminis]